MLFSFTAVMAIFAFKKDAVAAMRGFSLEPSHFSTCVELHIILMGGRRISFAEHLFGSALHPLMSL